MNDVAADERVTIRAPRGATLAIERAASRAHLTPGERARRLLLDGLRANGFDLADDVSGGTAEVLPFARS